MKRLIFRYFSLLFLFLVIGVNLFGSENSKGEIPVPDKENIEKASDKFKVSMNLGSLNDRWNSQVGKSLLVVVGYNFLFHFIKEQNLYHVKANSKR